MFSSLPSAEPRLDALRAEVRKLEAAGRMEGREALPFGVDAIDGRLAGGGLAVPALHETAGAGPGRADDAAATLFVAAIAARRGGGTVLWAMGSRRDLFAPGLALAGLPPARLIFAECGRDEDVLAAMEEGLRHGGLAAVVGEIGSAAMAATRRLQLAAEESGTTALMLKRWRRRGEDPLAPPSAAMTRWRIGCAPSAELPFEGIGRPRWRVELARQRGGESHHWIMERSDGANSLALPADLADGSHPASRARGKDARRQR